MLALSASEEAEIRAAVASPPVGKVLGSADVARLLGRLLATLDREREVRSDLARQVAGLRYGPDADFARGQHNRAIDRVLAILAGTEEPT